MNWDERLLLWNEAAVKLLDIRCVLLSRGDEPQGYLLPSSALLWVRRGRARVVLAGTDHAVEGFYLMHGAKGDRLDIFPTGDGFAYDILLYKARLPVPGSRFLHRMLERGDPFRMHCGFAPAHPLALETIVRRMEESWRKRKPLDKLLARGLFYQFVHEWIAQLKAHEASTDGPGLVGQAVRYIQDHYAQPITVEGLAGLLDCSASYLSRLLKKQLGTTPNDYLIRVRMDHARHLLAETNASLQEIAASIGYPDVYYFSRIFKKQTGLPPLRYRSAAAGRQAVQNNPSNRSDQAIVPLMARSYNLVENHYQRGGEGEFQMYKDMKPSVAAVMLLCVTLLFSGCASSTGANESSVASSSPAASQSGIESQQAKTKTVRHLMGETEIPIDPQRIAAAGLEDILLALDAPLVQAQSMEGHYLYGTLQQKNIPAIYTPGKMNYEAILDAKPDLIVAFLLASDEETYNSLSKIAPTVVYDRGNWKDSIVEVGKALNREEQAQAVIQAYDAKLKQAKETIVQKVGSDRSVAFIRPSAKDVQIFFSTYAYTRILYNELGLKVDPAVEKMQVKEKEGEWGITASFEVLPELAADYLFVTAGGSYDLEDAHQDSVDKLAEMDKLKLWQDIPAVKQGQVHMVSSRHWMLNGPLADSMKIDDVLAALVPQ